MVRVVASLAWLAAVGLVLVFGGKLAGSVDAAAQSAANAVQPVEITYRRGSSPLVESAQLSGPQDEKGAFYTSRLRLEKGGQVAPHTHPDARYTTVLSGTLYVCTSD